MKHTLLIFIGLISIVTLSAQNRVDRPLQIHLNANGTFLKTSASLLADKEIDALTVNKWLLPGISISYHLNKRFSFVYSIHPNRNLILKEEWTFGTNENDINLNLNHNTGTFHSLEARYFPTKLNLYGSFFLSHTSRANYNLTTSRMGSSMALGNSFYESDLEADWNFKSLNTIGFGLGYNQVFSNGFSFDIGFGIPLPFSNPLYENIHIKSASGSELNAEDINLGKTKIENELFYFPVHLYLNVGYNFKPLLKK